MAGMINSHGRLRCEGNPGLRCKFRAGTPASNQLLRLAPRPRTRVPAMVLLGRTRPKGQPNTRPAGGWTALRELAGILLRERSFFRGVRAFMRQNKPGGFACVSCAWAKTAK